MNSTAMLRAFCDAVEQRNGSMVWRSAIGAKVKSSPAIDQGLVLVGCEDCRTLAARDLDGNDLVLELARRLCGSEALL